MRSTSPKFTKEKKAVYIRDENQLVLYQSNKLYELPKVRIVAKLDRSRTSMGQSQSKDKSKEPYKEYK